LLPTFGLLIATDANGNAAPIASDHLVAVNIHDGQSTCPLGQPPGWLADAMTRVQPDYPDWATLHHEQGTGVFRMTIDPTTGRVTKVTTIKSTGSRSLDDSANDGLRRWRWKAGTWKEADVQIFFVKGSKKGDFQPSSKR
jgi:TonB family protein